MKVLVFVMASEDSEAGRFATEQEMREMGALNRKLVDAGVLVDGDGLRPSSRCARVTLANGQATVTHGPFGQIGELVSGYWIWEVESLEAAIEWAKQCPAPNMTLEIRPVITAEDFGEAFTPELQEAEAQMRTEVEQQKKS